MIGRERSERETVERERRESLYVLGDREPPLRDDAGENQYAREPPEIVRLLLSTKERYVFFFLLDAERGDNDEVAERTTSERICGDFFLP